MRTERIQGEQAIRQAIQKWRQHLITHWRNEPLRMVHGTPIQELYTIYEFHFEGGWVGVLSSLNNMRYLSSGCVVLAFVDTEDPLQPQPVLRFEPNYDPYARENDTLLLYHETFKVCYDPIALLYNLLIRRASLVPEIKKRSLTATEILELSKQYIEYGPDGWIRIDQNFFPAELLTIAQERL